jgi:hypothetical protein
MNQIDSLSEIQVIAIAARWSFYTKSLINDWAKEFNVSTDTIKLIFSENIPDFTKI